MQIYFYIRCRRRLSPLLKYYTKKNQQVVYIAAVERTVVEIDVKKKYFKKLIYDMSLQKMPCGIGPAEYIG
jgi:hypothetical protein